MPLSLFHLLCFIGGYWSTRQERGIPAHREVGLGERIWQNRDAVMPRLPLTSFFWLLHRSSQFKLLSCWTSLSVFLFAVSCSTSPGKLGMLKWGHVSANSPFWQIGYGAASELCPRTAAASLGALFSSLRCTWPNVLSTFSGSDVPMVVRFERCHRVCAVKLQCIRISRGLSPNIDFNIHSRVWKPEIKSFPNLYLQYKTFWQQSFWYWDTDTATAGARKLCRSKQSSWSCSSVHTVWRQKHKFRLLR